MRFILFFYPSTVLFLFVCLFFDHRRTLSRKRNRKIRKTIQAEGRRGARRSRRRNGNGEGGILAFFEDVPDVCPGFVLSRCGIHDILLISAKHMTDHDRWLFFLRLCRSGGRKRDTQTAPNGGSWNIKVPSSRLHTRDFRKTSGFIMMVSSCS